MYILGIVYSENTMKLAIAKTSEIIEKTYFPKEIIQYCKKCSRFNECPSCPPHQISIKDYLKDYSFMLLVKLDVLDSFAFTDDNFERFIYYRKMIDPVLYNLESSIEHSKAIVAGTCVMCGYQCSGSRICSKPELLRYSFESLGFDVQKIVETFLEDELTFTKGKFTYVFGLLLRNA